MATAGVATKLALAATLGLGTIDLCVINFVLAPKLDSQQDLSGVAIQQAPTSKPEVAPARTAAPAPSPTQVAAAPATPSPALTEPPPEPLAAATATETDKTATAPAAPPTPTPPPAADTSLEVPATRLIHFPSSGAGLNNEAVAELSDVLQKLQAQPRLTVLIRGHADQAGDPSLNLWLSQMRAKAASDYLINAGIASSRVQTEWLGSREPAKQGQSPADMAYNRRVEIVWHTEK